MRFVLCACLMLLATPAAADPALTSFALPAADANPAGITTGPDGALWFTERGPLDASANPLGPARIGRITLDGTVTEFATPTANAAPFGIATGPDGNLWFAERLGNRIGRVTIAGIITEFSLPTSGSQPFGIAAGPDGALWFTEQAGNRIGRITMAGAISEFAIPTAGSGPAGITAGPDGNLWFTESTAFKIGRITPSGVVTEFPGGEDLTSFLENNITAGPDGALWFATNCNQIGRITTEGEITFYPPFDGNCSLMAEVRSEAVTVGPDTALYLTEVEPFGFGLSIQGYTLFGALNGVAVKAATPPYYDAIVPTAGPDGAIWFIDGAGAIGRLGPLADSGSLAAALLPSSRSVQLGVPATAFATLINGSTRPAIGCTIVPAESLPAQFYFQTTDPATNAPIGPPGTPVTLAPGASQSFLLSLTPTAPFGPSQIGFAYSCASAGSAPSNPALDSLLLSASATPVPDLIVEAQTPSGDGILVVAGSGAFALATDNVGAAAPLTVTADTGDATLPLALTLCQTDPATGRCINPVSPAASVTVAIAANATPTFAIFATASGAVPFQPATNRIFVRFRDAAGAVHGLTSVAVRTQ